MNSEKIKSCPFCGCGASLNIDSEEDNIILYALGCSNSLCCAKNMICFSSLAMSENKTVEDAIKMWNARA